MATKILEKNGVENTNIDGARFNRFCAGNRNGIIQGAFDNAQISILNSNTLQIAAGEFLISGFRVIIDATEFAFSTFPSVATRYHLVAQIQLDAERQPTFTLFVRPISNLTQNDLFDESVNNSIYQMEVARFTLGSTGIVDLLVIADTIVGGTNEGANINVGNVVTDKIDMDLDAEVDIDSRYDEELRKHFVDFQFHLPLDFTKIEDITSEALGLATEAKMISSTSNSIATQAETIANKAVSDAGRAINIATQANDTSDEAKEIATDAGGIANNAEINASNAVTTANNALAVVEEQSVDVNNAINRANTISADLEQKVASDYYRGEKGDKGDTGDTGATPDITITAESLAAGSTPTVTKSGTAEAPTFALGIPKGEKGDKGDTGGVTSVAGETGDVTATQLIEAILTGNTNRGDTILKKWMYTTGYIVFKSGLQIAWGVASTSTTTITFDTNISFYSATYVVMLTPTAVGATFMNYCATNKKSTGFTINRNGDERHLQWVAIGKSG